MIEFRMPSLGADMEAGTLVEWLVKPGDLVHRGDVIALVDTQKGLFDIEVFNDGKVETLKLSVGERVPVGTVMALISGIKESAPKEAIPPQAIAAKETPINISLTREEHEAIKASPLAKRIAKEIGIDLASITGTGEEGTITKADIEKAAADKKSNTTTEKTKPKGKTGATPATIRMAIAAAMAKANREIPHYYLETKIDMRNALAWLSEANKQRSVKQRLLPAALFLKSLAKALREVPELNAYWEDGLQLKEQVNIGFVVSLRTGGILIPAIRDADKKTVDEIMEWMNEAIPRARALNLRSSDLKDISITLTCLSEGSVETVYGVIYPPQVALVGLGSITEQPWTENGMLDVRPVMTATLAADHRATDGQMGSRFLMAFKNYLQQPEAL